MRPEPSQSSNDRRSAVVVLWIAFGLICIFPYLSRLSHPSLYSDDILRIADLKTTTLSHLLVRPFNEHLAPLFELVSWTAWTLSGRSLVIARWTFTLASYVSFLACLIVLGMLLYKEFGSMTTAMVGVATFSLSSLSAEVVYWYSASSFSWALLCTLGTLYYARLADEKPLDQRKHQVFSAILACLAPMGSGLGLLAGPLGSIQSAGSTNRLSTSDRLAGTIIPILGTAAYFLFGWAFHYQSTLATSFRDNADLPMGLWHAIRAPIVVLIPGLLGISNVEDYLSILAQALLALIFWSGVLTWSIRSPRRPLLLGGFWLILGGYAVTYPLRVRKQSLDLLEYQRYHYFPQAGLVLLLACLLYPLLRRFDVTPIRRLIVATLIGTILLALHQGELRSRANLYHFPQQSRTFLAVEHLERLCLQESITRKQALAALEPIRSRWFPHDFNALTLLGPTVQSATLSDSLVRPTLLSGLNSSELEALFGFMDATRYVRPSALSAPESIAIGRLTDRRSVHLDGRTGHYVADAWPAYLEYQFEPVSGPSLARSLLFPGCASIGPVEVWWTDGVSPWSEFRSFRWRPESVPESRDWTIPLDSVPHLDRFTTRRIRIYFREPGPLALEAPRLVR